MLTPEQPEPLRQIITITGDGNVIGNNNTVTVTHTLLPANAAERRNRATMLQLVHNTWIAGVLEQSIHGAAMLELHKDYDPQAVARPWDIELHMPGRERRPVPHGTPIRDLFDQCGGTLLILGDPGSGKTTTLLQLSRALIPRKRVSGVLAREVIFSQTLS